MSHGVLMFFRHHPPISFQTDSGGELRSSQSEAEYNFLAASLPIPSPISMVLPNLNLSKKSRASDADLETLALSMAGGDGDDDDDDFQNPSHAAALSQSLILSSHKSSRSQPLKPSIGGSRSRKRPRSSAATGKENRSMSKNQCSDFRISKAGVEKIAASTERREFRDKIGRIDSGKRDVVVRFCEDDGIEVPKLELSTSSVLCEDGEVEKGSHCFVPVESSLLRSGMSASSSFERSDSDVCVINDELGAKAGDCYDLDKSLAKRRTKSAGECKNCDGTEKEEACLASTEFRLEEYRPRRNMEVQILNHSVEWGKKEEEKGSPCVNSSEVRLLGLKEKPVFSRNEVSGGDCCDKSDTSKQTKEAKAKEKGAIGGELFLSRSTCKEDIDPVDKRKENHYAMSMEAKLLDPRGKLVPSTMGGSCLEVGSSEEFEPGTQLNMLMDLCCKMDEQYGSGSGTFSFEQINVGTQFPASELNSLVVCPLCGSDITKLSEDMRQIHTNDCLDKDETTEVSVPISQTKPDACQQLVDTNPVLEWLRALDLCQYEEAFIREEIDWDTLQWLTEEDVISIGVVALGPRKKIVHALNALRQRNCLVQDRENDASNVALNEKTKLALQGNKLITEYFHGHVPYKMRGSNQIKSFHMVERSSNHPTQKRVGNRRNANRGRVRDIPPWCCIPGTPFRVDAFRYLRGDCSHWFLTHFHMDHYQGLTKNFCHGKVFCSKITAHLVNMKIGVPWDRIQILHLNQTIMIAGVSVTCLDANHCPGSIIILFEPSNNKTILHTGDFRFSAEMAASSVLHSSHIHTLILDTTYCNPQYDFPKQEEVFQFVIDAIQAEAFNPKTLFLIGTYTIGKERLFLEVARTLRRKVYVGAEKLHLLRCLGLPEEDMEWFTSNEMESHIHVVPMWTIASFKRMKYISNQYSDCYNLIVAFSPTGWTFGKGKKKAPGRRWQQGTIIRYEVPYSEHCSFTELKDFVRFISPENIIPSVNNEGPESADAMIALLLTDS